MSEYTTNGRPGGLAVIDASPLEELTPPAPHEGPMLVLTCTTCHMVTEHPLDERISFECPDPDCGGWTLTARLEPETEPNPAPSVNRPGHVPGCGCDQDELCRVDAAEAHCVPGLVDEPTGVRVVAERFLSYDDGSYDGEVEDRVVISPDSGYETAFHPSQIAALIEGLRAARDLLAVRSIR